MSTTLSPEILTLPGTSVHSWQLDNGVLMIDLECQCRNAPCPGCGVLSTCVHGWYHRQIQDLSWQGYRVRVHVDVRRLRCITSPAPQHSPAGGARAGRSCIGRSSRCAVDQASGHGRQWRHHPAYASSRDGTRCLSGVERFTTP